MAGLKYTLICISAVCWGSVYTVTTTWTNAMNICALSRKPPLFEDDTKNGSWVGKAKYSFLLGTGILQIQRVERNKTCSDCDDQTKQCEFCDSRMQFNGSINVLDVLQNLKPRRKYILGEFGNQGLKGIPSPMQCLVNRGALPAEYVSCNDEFDDGCHDSGEFSGIYIIVSFDKYNTTPTSKDFVESTTQEIKDTENGSTQPQGHVLICLILILVQVHLREIWN